MPILLPLGASHINDNHHDPFQIDGGELSKTHHVGHLNGDQVLSPNHQC